MVFIRFPEKPRRRARREVIEHQYAVLNPLLGVAKIKPYPARLAAASALTPPKPPASSARAAFPIFAQSRPMAEAAASVRGL
jgi:hypothetical protein